MNLFKNVKRLNKCKDIPLDIKKSNRVYYWCWKEDENWLSYISLKNNLLKHHPILHKILNRFKLI